MLKSYNIEENKKEWDDELGKISIDEDKLAKSMYSTEDYYYIGFEIAKHGILILDFRGNIIDANPYFCNKLNFQVDELVCQSIDNFCVKADDLYGSDNINVTTLLTNNNQQISNQCEIKNKEKKLYRCQWVANRVPADLKYPFSHSIVHVYFHSESSYSKVINHLDKLERKEGNLLHIIFDNTWARISILLIIILTALGGTLPELIKHLLSLL